MEGELKTNTDEKGLHIYGLIKNETVYNKCLDLLYTVRYGVFRKAVDMFKFNVHIWTGKEWKYLMVSMAPNEQFAAKTVAKILGLKGRFASYPHIDSEIGPATSKSIFTVIE